MTTLPVRLSKVVDMEVLDSVKYLSIYELLSSEFLSSHRQKDGQTDARRCIRTHCALAKVGVLDLMDLIGPIGGPACFSQTQPVDFRDKSTILCFSTVG